MIILKCFLKFLTMGLHVPTSSSSLVTIMLAVKKSYKQFQLNYLLNMSVSNVPLISVNFTYGSSYRNNIQNNIIYLKKKMCIIIPKYFPVSM